MENFNPNTFSQEENLAKPKIVIFHESLKTFVAVFFAAFLFNFFISGAFNTYHRINVFKNVDFISAELQRNLSDEQKKVLEEKLLLIPEVKKINYVDSFISFENLQEDLGIVLPSSQNPLPDSFRIYAYNLNNFDNIQKNLDSIQEIKEYFVNTSYSNDINKQTMLLSVLSVFFVIFSAIMAYIILAFAIMKFKINYAVSFVNQKYPTQIKAAKMINLLPFSLAIILSTYSYFIFYFIGRNWLITNEISFSILSLFQFYLWQIGIIGLFILVIWLIPVKERLRTE